MYEYLDEVMDRGMNAHDLIQMLESLIRKHQDTYRNIKVCFDYDGDDHIILEMRGIKK